MKKTVLMGLALLSAVGVNAQLYKDLPNGDYYPGYNPVMNPDPSLRLHSNVRKAAGNAAYPDHWNTGTQRYFPPIINQGGYGSCGVCSHVGHMMTSEMNAWNNTDASDPANQLTPMFEYPFTYNGPGKDEMALAVGFPSADIYGGRYESSIYGGSEWKNSVWGWVQGYDIFYNAMKHRISTAVNFPDATSTPEGAAAVKAYLYNHAGDPNFGGRGGTVCIGVGIGASATKTIPNTDENKKIGVAGQQYLYHWNVGGYDHAMCLVGYDDRIEFDLDANGVAGEESNQFGQNEKGAWIIANSWGAGYANGGFVYCPYALDGGISKEKKNSAGVTCYTNPGYGWKPYVYRYRGDYTPLRTLKVKMDYSKRSEISVVGGVAEDTTATKPEHTFTFPYINFTGDGDGDGKDAETPMLGTWADKKVHTEPMEFGVDLTDLVASVNTRKPLKYFLIINSKSTASGQGQVYDASVIDYEMNPNGVETPFPQHNVQVQTRGKQTILSVVINGEAFNAPANLTLSGNTLSWNRPEGTAYSPDKYYVYKDGNQLGEATTEIYDITGQTGVFSVKAAYGLNGKEVLSVASNSVSNTVSFTEETAFDTHAYNFSKGAFYIPDIAKQSYSKFTLEFWIKPSNLIDWGDYIFTSGWGISYMIHTSADGSISAGWADGADRINTPSGSLKNGRWNHVALVIDGSRQTLYVDGTQKATSTSKTHSGMPSMGDGRITFGVNTSLRGAIDEVRVWSTARTAQQIKDNLRKPVTDITGQDGLMTYLTMESYTKDGTTYLKDLAGGHDAVIMSGSASATTVKDKETLSKSATSTSTLAINAPESVTRGDAVTLTSNASVATTSYAWTAEGAQPASTTTPRPTFCFSKAGTHKVSLSVTDIYGQTSTAEASINVVDVQPTAEFTVSADTVKGADRVGFTSLNRAPGCKYEWSMPDADEEKAYTANASASYQSAGKKTVTLTVTDQDGKTYSSSHVVIVKGSEPVAAYAISPSVVVKGQPVTLTDRSTYQPTIWQWTLRSDNSVMRLAEANGQVTPEKAGIYDLRLTVGNEAGLGTCSAERALIVCNTESKTGLNFYGSGDVQTMKTVLPTPLSTAWTLEFWYNPAVFTTSCDGIVGDNGFSMTSDASGNLTVNAGDRSEMINQFYKAGEWHHYAIVHSGSKLDFYRDTKLVGTASTLGVSDYSSMLPQITFGSAASPMRGVIDELKVWNKALTESDFRKSVTEPIADVTAAKAKGLQVYYNFDQSTGDVEDQCGNAKGTLSGFYNVVGYYDDSKGVFDLNFDSPVNETTVGKILKRANVKVVEVSSEDTKGRHLGVHAYDGNRTNYWSTASTENYPHWITFQRTVIDSIRSVKFTYGDQSNTRASSLTVEESDDNLHWTPVDLDHALFDFKDQVAVFSRPAVKPYVRITFNSGIDGGTTLQICELNFYGYKYDAATGIDDLNVEEENTADEASYNLSGQRVSDSYKGIVVKHGKKILRR